MCIYWVLILGGNDFRAPIQCFGPEYTESERFISDSRKALILASRRFMAEEEELVTRNSIKKRTLTRDVHAEGKGSKRRKREKQLISFSLLFKHKGEEVNGQRIKIVD